jgi:hypothetical protein
MKGGQIYLRYFNLVRVKHLDYHLVDFDQTSPDWYGSTAYSYMNDSRLNLECNAFLENSFIIYYRCISGEWAMAVAALFDFNAIAS